MSLIGGNGGKIITGQKREMMRKINGINLSKMCLPYLTMNVRYQICLCFKNLQIEKKGKKREKME